MHFLGHFLVSASSIIIISSASSANYDPDVSWLDDSIFWSVESDNFQEAGLNFLEPDLGFNPGAPAKDNETDAGATALNGNSALSSLDSDAPRLPSENEISFCTGDNNQASKRTLHRTRDMCTQESPEKKTIVPQIPRILDLGVKNRIVNEGFMIPWDDSPCYPPYTAHLCCSGPMTQLDWLSRLYANVVGCSPCSSLITALYSICITYQLTYFFRGGHLSTRNLGVLL